MLNIRRLPGIFFRHKVHFGLVFVVVSSALFVIHRWGLMCTNYEINREIDRLCKLHKIGEVVGNLCKPLCEDKEIHSISCISQHSKKQFVFTAKWNQRPITIKSSQINPRLPSEYQTETSQNNLNIIRHLSLQTNIPKILYRQSKSKSEDRTETKLESYPKHFPSSNYKNDKSNSGLGENEEKFEKLIRKLVSQKLNMTLTRAQLDDLRYLDVKNKFAYSETSVERKIEKENIFNLLQSQEYLLSRLFSDRDLFPQILGTCGDLYGVEYMESPKFNSMFTLDDKAEWSERMKIAVAIMDFVEEVETNFPDALHLCDIRMNHLGITNTGRIKFLDLDLVYMKNVIDKILKSGRTCKEHRDCDFSDCKSTCNLKENICDSGVANDNLQAICEKIFIGWTMSGKIIVPGLLMSEYTPASLSALLRLCAENSREPVAEDLRQRLYTTLTEMHQILIQKLLAK